MSQVHTEYGPGRIIAQETVRGRTRYKVAGEGFEVWVDQTKLGGYERPDEIDFNAPHWQGHEPTDAPIMYSDPVAPLSDDEYGEYADPRGLHDRGRMTTHPDYLSDDDPDAKYYATRRRAFNEDEYFQHIIHDDPHARMHGDEDVAREYGLRGDYRDDMGEDPDAHFYARKRKQAGPGEDFADEHFRDIVHDDPYRRFHHNPEAVDDLAREYGLGGYGGEEDPEARFYANRQVMPGKGNAHLAWAPMDDDNSTDLPYNPEPQYHAYGTPGDDGSSTIQPIHHIDADERLSPSDSITFDDADEADEPGPNPDLFAKEAAHTLLVRQYIKEHHPHLYKKVFDTGKGLVQNIPGVTPEIADKLMQGTEGASDAASLAVPLSFADRAVSKTLDNFDPGYDSGWGRVIHQSSIHEGGPEMLLPLVGPALRTLAPMAINHLMNSGGDGGGEQGGQQQGKNFVDQALDATDPGDWGGTIHDASYYARPAGLSDKYIDITAGADYHNDPVAQFRHDPDAYINRIGHLMDEGLNPRFAEYMDLVEGDSSVRTAAWKDVRAKAMRLKREGHVTVKDLAPNRIMASVVGDHGTYDVLILKGASLGSSHSISNWHCGCEWGKWAFRRKFTYVGRLCSHAYASYLTMQSAHMTGKPRQQRQPRQKAPARALPFLHVKRGGRGFTADALQNGPERLVPELVVNDTDDAHMFLDVTKDERTDVGPDDVVSEKDIVHFARVMQACERTQQPYPRELVAFLARYAECTDGGDETSSDWQAPDTEDAVPALNRLRNFADEGQEGDFGDMADRVHRIQDAVEEAREDGVDASVFVAAVRKMAEPTGDPGLNAYAENGGTGYVENANQPGTFSYQTIYPTGDGKGGYTTQKPNSQNQAQSAPSNGNERSGDQLTINRTGLPAKGDRSDAQKAINRTSIDTDRPDLALSEVNKGTGGQPATKGQASGQPAVGTGGNGGGSAQPMTSGPISDGGVAGAENGNNSAITKDQLDADGYYTVQKGDTLSDIAQRGYGDMNKYQDLAKANGIANPDVINEGQRIKIDNPTGNGGISGDKTNPAGSTKAVTGPAVDTSAVGSAAVEGVNAGGAIGTDTTPPTPAATPGTNATDAGAGAGSGTNNAPLAAESGSQKTQRPASRRRMAAEPGTETTDTTQPGGTPSSTTTNPGGRSAPATNPATSSTTSTTPKSTPGTPSQSGDTYDPNDPNQQAQQQSSQANPGTQQSGFASQSSGLGLGTGDVGSLIGQGVGAATDIASGLGSALPGMASGIGSAISGLAGGFLGSTSIFASKEDFDDWARYAYPTADGEGSLEPHTHPFAGSGYPGPLEIGTSEEYADKARKKHDDVTDLGDDPLSTPMGKWQRQSAIEDDDFDPYREASFADGTDDNSDIVREFQANLGDTALGAGAGGGAGRFDDIAGAAAGFLRTAGRNYSLAEQSELIREGDKGGARNLNSLDLRGTHYEDMNTLGW